MKRGGKYAGWHSDPRHQKVHWVIFFAIAIATVAALLNAIDYPSATEASESSALVSDFSESTALALGLHRLTEGEYAVIEKKGTSLSGITSTNTVKLQSGQMVAFDGDKNSTFNIIEGSNRTNTYVKLASGVEVHSVDEVTALETKQKLDPATLRRTGDLVPVIIQLNLPFDKFYEKAQGQSVTSEKEARFAEVRSRVSSLLGNRGTIKADLKIINGVSANVKKEVLGSLKESSFVKRIELDRVAKVNLDTSAAEIKAPDVWPLFDSKNNSLTGVGQVIAIIDTGVDYTIPDLGGCIGPNCKVISGYNFVGNNSNPMDDQGHGTHVAATAAGKGVAANGTQLWGVAPDAKIIAYKVCDSGGSCSYSAIISAIQASIDPNKDGNTADHVNVGSMSLGGPGNPDDSLSLAVDNATLAGVVYTVAAGNSGPSASTIGSPGASRSAITVAAACKASDIGKTGYCAGPIASFSSRGPVIWNGVDTKKPDIAAPGVFICAARWANAFAGAPTCFDDKHIRISGTSMATPHMAGAAALLLQSNPALTPSQVKQILKSNAVGLTGQTYNDQGDGEVNLKAAIPLSQKVISTPGIWQAASVASGKVSVVTKSFSVKPSASDITNLTITVKLDVPGVTVKTSKTSLQVSNLGSDTFSADITVDNDLAKAGNYNGSIIFSQDGINLGGIPILLTVTSTLTVAPTAIADFGTDDPSQGTWVSLAKTFTVTNVRSDVSQTVNISAASFPIGVTVQSTATITIPAGGTQTFDAKLSADNTKVANNIYNGLITLSNSANQVGIPAKFTKFYVVTVTDGNTADIGGALVYLHDRSSRIYLSYGPTIPTFYLNTPGTYDLVVGYGFNVSNVFKEGISVQGGQTAISVSKTMANNSVKIVPTDISGNNIAALTNLGTQTMVYKNNGVNTFVWLTFGGRPTQYYYSNASAAYPVKLVNSTTPPVIYDYFGEFAGIQGDLSFTNTLADLKKTNLTFDLDQQTGTLPFWPYFMHCAYNFCSGMSNVAATVPVKGTLYSTMPAGEFTYFSTTDFSDRSPYFNSARERWYDYYKSALLPTNTDTSEYIGRGPVFFAPKFQNSSTSVNLVNYFSGSASPAIAFFRQDHSVKKYPQTSYIISQNGGQVATGNIPSFSPGGYGFTNSVSSVGVPSGGAYQFDLDFPYVAHGATVGANVKAIFDTTKTDPNPPAIKRMAYYANGVRSEVYDSSGDNRVEFELDPIGGTLLGVTVDYSKDGSTFEPLALVCFSNGFFGVDIPNSVSTSNMRVRLSATDASNNSLAYTFGLPAGTAPTGTAITPSATVPCGFGDVPVAPHISLSPSTLAFSSITGGAAPASKTVTVSNSGTKVLNWSATADKTWCHVTPMSGIIDPSGATELSVSVDAMTSAGKFTCALSLADPAADNSPQTVNASYAVTDSVVPPPENPDIIAPTATLVSPLAGTVLKATKVVITGIATDDIGISKVEFYVNKKVQCTDLTAPYSCTWNVPGVAGKTYPIQAKAYDAAGNSGLSAIVNVTAK